MPLTHEENEALVRVGRGTLMGDMLRTFWHPVLRSERLVADGQPLRVRLLGDNYVAFRATDGRIGFFAEGCPHRGVSMVLADNCKNGLRCIFHGWKIDVSGELVHVPTEPSETATEFAKRVKVYHYPVREVGGLLWVYVGAGEPPDFPLFEFLEREYIDVRIGVFHCNWIQGMEAVLDSAHLGQLHRSSFPNIQLGGVGPEIHKKRVGYLLEQPAPKFEFLDTDYGFREAAIRELKDGTRHVNLRQFVAPYYSFLPGGPGYNRILCISVPNDDEWVSQFFITFNPTKPLEKAGVEAAWLFAPENRDNIRGDLGDASNNWHQNRTAMKIGHASGFPNLHFFQEDFIVQESMGPIVDRTNENLGTSDDAIVYARSLLLKSACAYRNHGKTPWGLSRNGEIDYRSIRSTSKVIGPEEDWRDIDTHYL